MEAFTGKSACIKLDVSTTYFLIKQYNNSEMKTELQKISGGSQDVTLVLTLIRLRHPIHGLPAFEIIMLT